MQSKILSQSSKSIKLEVEIPLSSTMLKSEEAIQSALNDAGMIATQQVLSNFDTDGSPIVKSNKQYTTKGKLPKQYQTPYGAIEVERHVYQSSEGGKVFCPLEHSGRIIKNGTPQFGKQISSKYANMGSRMVQKDLEENHGRHISRNYICELSEAIGQGLSEKELLWNYTLPVEPENVASIGISLDGTCMYLTNEGYREAMVGTLSLYDKQGERLYTHYTAHAPEYGKGSFHTKFSREINHFIKTYPQAHIVGIADGAKDNWSYLAPFVEEQILDYFHATEYISLAAQTLFGIKRDSQRWVKKMCHELKHEPTGAEKVLTEMKKYPNKKYSENKGKELKRAITYFENHKHQMKYEEYQKKNYPIGSGVVEAACKVIIKQRLCNSGMKWKINGANSTLTLRCLNNSDTKWTQTWDKINQYGL